MSLKNIVVEGCEFEIYENEVLNSNGSVSVDPTSVVSSNTSIDSKGVYTTLAIQVSGFTSSNISNWISGSGSTQAAAQVTSSALYTSVDGNSVFLEGDEAIGVVVVGKVQVGQSQVDTPCTVTVKIKSAGQSVVTAE